jgi:hypothetical protein
MPKDNPNLMMTGQLYPSDGVPGCKFIVEYTDRHLLAAPVHARLFSPYGNNELVDSATIPLEKLGAWLEERMDY